MDKLKWTTLIAIFFFAGYFTRSTTTEKFIAHPQVVDASFKYISPDKTLEKAIDITAANAAKKTPT